MDYSYSVSLWNVEVSPNIFTKPIYVAIESQGYLKSRYFAGFFVGEKKIRVVL